MKNDNKKNYQTTIKTNNALYEMVCDQAAGKTSFVKVGPDGSIKKGLYEVQHQGETYIPIPVGHQYITSGALRLSTQPEPHGGVLSLFVDICSHIHKYVDLSPEFEKVAANYVLMTWLYDKFNQVPYLRVIGDYGSGKSRFLETVGGICYKATITGGASSMSSDFRMIDAFKGTFVIDEADMSYSDKTSDMVKLLNLGYQRGGNIMRTEGERVYDVKVHDVFCPKIVAAREPFRDRALESRFLTEEMGVLNVRPDIPYVLENSFYEEARSLRNRLLQWRLENYFKPMNLEVIRLDGIHPRLNQIIIPLLSVLPDKETQQGLIDFVTLYNESIVEDQAASLEGQIVRVVDEMARSCPDDGVLSIKEITKRVNKEHGVADQIKERSIGHYLSKKLLLKTKRLRDGTVLSPFSNKKKLQILRRRYGVGEHVNVVSVAKAEGTSATIVSFSNDLGHQ